MKRKQNALKLFVLNINAGLAIGTANTSSRLGKY